MGWGGSGEGGWEVIRSPTCPTTTSSSLSPSSLLPWLVSMCRAQGHGNEWRPGCASSLKPARNARPLFFSFPLSPLPLLFRRPAALAAICSSEIFPPLRSLCIGELDVIGWPISGFRKAAPGLGGGRKDSPEVFSLISSSPGYLVW